MLMKDVKRRSEQEYGEDPMSFIGSCLVDIIRLKTIIRWLMIQPKYNCCFDNFSAIDKKKLMTICLK